MTTSVIVEARCAPTKEVQIYVSGELSEILQDGDRKTIYAYGDNVIEIKEVEKIEKEQ